MNEPSPSSASHLLRDAVLRKEELFDQFSGLWRSGSGTSVADFLRDVGATDVSDDVLSELLAIEHDHRRERGEPMTRHELTDRLSGQVSDRETSQLGLGDEATTAISLGPSDRVKSHETVQNWEGRLFGDYELIEEIARGGMGIVFKARQRSLNRIVAVKMILAGQLASSDDVKRFRTEAEAAANLDHPGIVPIFEVGEHDGQHYFSMGFVDGMSLAKCVADGPLPPRAAAHLVRQVALAVQYAHDKGVIHRDLKPANILLANGGREPPGLKPASDTSPEVSRPPFADVIPKITDFGLAKRVQGGSELTASGQVLGTPSYMPPEQAEGKVTEIGPAADVYSLGAVLYCLLTGRPPFQSANPLDTLLQVLEREPVPLRQLNAEVPLDLETITLKCLQKDPTRRYQSAAALSADLRRWLTGHPIEARPVSRTERAWRWCHRNPAIASLSAIVVLVLLTGMAVSSFFALQSAARNRDLLKETARANRKTLEAQAKADEALTNAKKTQIEKDRADAKADEARRHLYSVHMNLAQRNSEIPLVGLVLDSLEKTHPQSGETDLRGFEWYYWDRLCHSSLLDLKGHTGSVISVAFSADGKRLASASSDQTVKVWDVTSGQETLTLEGHTGSVMSVVFSADGKRLASASDDQTVKVWDATSGEETLTLKGHTRQVESVAFRPDGKQLASASHDQTVKVWDAISGQETLTLNGHNGQVISVAFSPDGKRLASASWDKTVKVWDATSGQETLTLKGHTDTVTSVAFSPDGKRLVSGSWDKTMKVWDATGGQETLTLKGHTDWVTNVAFSADGKRLASASHDLTVKVWDATSGQETLTLNEHIQIVKCVAFSADGKRLASASDDQTVKVWDATGRKEMLTLKGHTNFVTSVAFSADGTRLASASLDQTMKLWNTTNGHEALTLKGHNGGVRGVAFNADGTRLASASDDQTLKMWDATSGEELLTLKGHTGSVMGVAFSPDGERLASASWDHTVKVWDVTSGQETLTLTGHTYGVTSVAFSADGKRLASGSPDRTVKVWDATSGQETLTLKGHTDWVTSATFSADGKRLVSASHDRRVKVWDAVSGQETLTLKGHTDRVMSVTFSADGQRLASASGDHTVKVWDARPWTPELRAEQEALSLIHWLRDQGQAQTAWLDTIAADQTLSPPVRDRALQFAREWK